jgi:BioD-like phosphotransacetylase family protein
VGSVFDLSNAQVARLLRSKVIIVSQGGIGKPIDEIAINLALFEKYGVEVIGAVFNKVLPDKIEELRFFAQKGLERIGLPLLGIIPMHQELYKPTLNQICLQIKGQFLSGGQYKRRRVAKVTIGAMSSRNIEHHFEPDTLIITPGDRDDIITAILGDDSTSGATIAGVILTSGMRPDGELMLQIRDREIPFIAAQGDPYSIVSAVTKMTVKTEIEDKEKIELIQNLVVNNISIDRILEAVDLTEPALA